MVDDLFKYYNTRISFYSQISKEKILASSLILSIGCILLLAGFYNVIFYKKYLCGILALSSLPFLVFLIRLLNIRTIKKKFPKMYISIWKWNTKKFHDRAIKKLSAKINKKNPDLDLLQKQIRENANKEKASVIIIVTLLGALFVPLWSAYISEIMDISEGKLMDLNFKFIIFSIGIISLSILGYHLMVIREYLLTDYQKWNKLNDLITECRIRKTIGNP